MRDIVAQQFQYGQRIERAVLVSILEAEVSIESPRKEQAEALLRDALHSNIQALPGGATTMLKLTISTWPTSTLELAAYPGTADTCLTGGYHREKACELLVNNPAI